MNENKFLREIGFALSMLNESDASYKLCALNQIIEEAKKAKEEIKKGANDEPRNCN